MRLWQFTFCDQAFEVALINAAGNTSADAVGAIAHQLGILIDMSPEARKSRKRVIAMAAGEDKAITQACVTRVVPRGTKPFAIISGELKPGDPIIEHIL